MATTLELVTAGALITVAFGCSTVSSHRGAWAFEDAKTYFGIAFDSADTCRFVGVAKGQAGVGAFCSYVRRGDVITIVEVWDRTGVREKMSSPFAFTYEPQTDTLILKEDTRERRLSRTAELIEG